MAKKQASEKVDAPVRKPVAVSRIKIGPDEYLEPGAELLDLDELEVQRLVEMGAARFE